MRIRPKKLELFTRPCSTRLPFRFGISTMTEAPMLTAAVTVETESGESIGYAGELMVPKWFAKNPESEIARDNEQLVAAVRAAFDAMTHDGPRDASVFELWLQAQMRCVETGPAASDAGSPHKTPRLVSMFGVAMVERALMDAVCRAAGTTFHGALRSDAFGIRFGELEPRLGGWSAEDLGKPSSSVRVRHTVGLVDALEDAEVPKEARVGDDHPLALTADIEAYGLDCFKLKVCGQDKLDLYRLETIAALTPKGATFTLDGNEQYAEPGALADVLDELEARGNANHLLSGLMAIEQPVARFATFRPESAEGIARLSERAPVIIDEADADLSSYPAARALGYGGVSMKACKGVLRALLNRARIDADGEGIQSAEDLTNLPVLPLHQDLAVVRALALPHVERNGHHYFRGQSHLTDPEKNHLGSHHPSLYRERDGDLFLNIEGGRLDLSSIDDEKGSGGFGYCGPIDSHSGQPAH